MGSPASKSRNAWTEKVEKVVKPPRKPTPSVVRSCGEAPVCDDEDAEQERPEGVDGERHPRQGIAVHDRREAVAGQHAARPGEGYE